MDLSRLLRSRSSPSKGQILIEALLGLAVVSIVLVVLVSLTLRSLKIQLLNKQWEQADMLEQEALEAIRQIRDGYGHIRYDSGVQGIQEIDWIWDDATVWNTAPLGQTYFRLYYDAAQSRWILDKTVSSDPKNAVYRLAWNSATSSFGYAGLGGFPAGAKLSPMYRQIVFTNTTDTPLSRSVSCVLTWYDRGTMHQTKLVTLLSNW